MPDLRIRVTAFTSALLLAASLGCGNSNNTTANTNAPAPTPGSAGGSGSGGSGGGGGSTAPTVVAFAYVGSAPSPSDERIFGFALRSDGSLTALPSSPYTGPATSMVTNGAAVFALANSPENPLASYSRATDGSLRMTSSTPVNAHTGPGGTSSGGVSLSLDHSGTGLYVGVINADGTENNEYGVYNVSSGTPQFVANTAPNVEIGARLAFSPDNKFAYSDGCHFADWEIVGYKRNSDATLTSLNPNAGIPVTGTKGSCPGPYAMSARNVFALMGRDGPTGTIVLATYSVNGDGTLALANKFTVAGVTGIRALQFDPTGAFLASVDDRGVVVYRVADDGSLTPTGSPMPGTFNELHWDNAGHLFAIDAGALSVFTNADGMLTRGATQVVPSTAGFAVLPTS